MLKLPKSLYSIHNYQLRKYCTVKNNKDDIGKIIYSKHHLWFKKISEDFRYKVGLSHYLTKSLQMSEIKIYGRYGEFFWKNQKILGIDYFSYNNNNGKLINTLYKPLPFFGTLEEINQNYQVHSDSSDWIIIVQDHTFEQWKFYLPDQYEDYISTNPTL